MKRHTLKLQQIGEQFACGLRMLHRFCQCKSGNLPFDGARDAIKRDMWFDFQLLVARCSGRREFQLGFPMLTDRKPTGDSPRWGAAAADWLWSHSRRKYDEARRTIHSR